jgi:hypothetical protein
MDYSEAQSVLKVCEEDFPDSNAAVVSTVRYAEQTGEDQEPERSRDYEVNLSLAAPGPFSQGTEINKDLTDQLAIVIASSDATNAEWVIGQGGGIVHFRSCEAAPVEVDQAEAEKEEQDRSSMAEDAAPDPA